MYKIISIFVVSASLAACQTGDPVSDRAAGGALLGAGAGAVIGGVVSGDAGGALAGAAIGGISGAAIGAATTPSPRYGRRICEGYDRNGNLVRYRCR
jgi:osmotically inducible lipoprotein OsmB